MNRHDWQHQPPTWEPDDVRVDAYRCRDCGLVMLHRSDAPDSVSWGLYEAGNLTIVGGGRPDEVPECDPLARILEEMHSMNQTVPRIYALMRDEDESGVSGTGHVAWAVRFPSGLTVVHFRPEIGPKVSSAAVYQSFEDAVKCHGHGGKTRFVEVEATDA